MACSVLHTDDEVEALVQKLIDEDMVRQKSILDLALQFDNACTAKDGLRKAYEKCNDIPQESRALIDTFLKKDLIKITNSSLNNENDQWELGLDIDDSDLLLTPVLRLSSSTRVETSPSTQNPVRIPGPAGIVQATKLLKQRDILLGAALILANVSVILLNHQCITLTLQRETWLSISGAKVEKTPQTHDLELRWRKYRIRQVYGDAPYRSSSEDMAIYALKAYGVSSL
ncbi:hypothetical protein Tco_0368926 [Tanacetum coccineum]